MGGLLSPPFFVTDSEDPVRLQLAIWMDGHDGTVVGQKVIEPEDADGALSRTLIEAMNHPLAGSPRRPDRVRFADPAHAAEVQAALGEKTPIEIAPTPELDALLETMYESMSTGEEIGSYLEDGRVSVALVERLFTAASVLYDIAPWQLATDNRTLRMDIPTLGVSGACVTIIGNLGESLGLLIFPSLTAYEAFLIVAEEIPRPMGLVDLGSDWLALAFERGADLPNKMRKEVSSHGWPVADANAYPRVTHHDRDGFTRPLVERDVKIVTACARSLSVFFATHRILFESESFEPVCESYFDDDDLEVRFTVPYEAFDLFDVEDAPDRMPPARRKVGRNDRCPCGSGKKYKKCHQAEDEAEAPANRVSQQRDVGNHDLDARLTGELGEYAMTRFGLEWRRFTKDFVDFDSSLQLAVPWSVYQYEVEGRSIVDRFRAEFGGRLSREERRWLSAQQAAWLSVWEVTQLEPGVSLTLRDLLSGEERYVREVIGSQTLTVRDALLGRVVDDEGTSLLCGTHPRPLPPLEASEVVRRARGRLRRKRAVPIDRLREESFGRYLIKRWEEAVAELDLRANTPPVLQNTDGDPLLLTVDHFGFDPNLRAEIEANLSEIAELDTGDTEEDIAVYVFVSAGNRAVSGLETVLTGRASLSGAALRLETNSVERADALRRRVARACGALIEHRAREHADPVSPPLLGAPAGALKEIPTPEAEQLMLEYKREHYAKWPDQPLPALGGLSPREAVETAHGRDSVDVLLKDMENRETRSAGSSAFEFDEIRRVLGLD